MPARPSRPCMHPGCTALVSDGTGRCTRHPRPQWAKTAPTKRITGRKLQRLRRSLFEKHPLCVGCQAVGRTTLATIRDHVVPLAEGGADDETNVQGLCEVCHDIKSEAERIRGQRRT